MEMRTRDICGYQFNKLGARFSVPHTCPECTRASRISSSHTFTLQYTATHVARRAQVFAPPLPTMNTDACATKKTSSGLTRKQHQQHQQHHHHQPATQTTTTASSSAAASADHHHQHATAANVVPINAASSHPNPNDVQHLKEELDREKQHR